MSRRKDKKNDDTEARKKRVRSFRNRERRQRRANDTPDSSDVSWLTRNGIITSAMKVLNSSYSQLWPFWLSIPLDYKGQNGPTSNFYPCRSYHRGNRIFYAFMFREHRDEQCLLWPDARKELTPSGD